MSFGASPSDIIIVVTFCKALYRKCRSAGGEYDEISREVRGLHTVLRHLKYEVEAPDSPLNHDRSIWGQQLAPIIGDCDFTMKQLDGLLMKYGRLAASNRGNAGSPTSARVVWDKMKFGNNEMDQLGGIRVKLISHKTSLTLFLDTIQLHQSGQMAVTLGTHGDQLDVILDKVDKIAGKMQQRNGSVMTSYEDDNKEVWKQFRRELVAEGFSSDVLQQHKDVLRAYIREIDQQGLLEPDSPLPPPPVGSHTARWLENIPPPPSTQPSTIVPTEGPPSFESLNSPTDDNGAKEMMIREDNMKFPPSMKLERPKPESRREGSQRQLAIPAPTSRRSSAGSQRAPSPIPKLVTSSSDEKEAYYINTDSETSDSETETDSKSSSRRSHSPSYGQIITTTNLLALSQALTLHPSSPNSIRSAYSYTEDGVSRSMAHRPKKPPEYPSPSQLQTGAITIPSPNGKSPAALLGTSPIPAPYPIRLAPDAQGNEIPPDARWTKISRRLVSPEVLDQDRRRYEARPEFVAVLGVLSRAEIQDLAARSHALREARKRRHFPPEIPPEKPPRSVSQPFVGSVPQQRPRGGGRDTPSSEEDYSSSSSEDDRRRSKKTNEKKPKPILKNNYTYQQQQQQYNAPPSPAWSPASLDRGAGGMFLPPDQNQRGGYYPREPRDVRDRDKDRSRDEKPKSSRKYHSPGGQTKDRSHRNRGRDGGRDREKDGRGEKEIPKGKRPFFSKENLTAASIGGAAVSLLNVLSEAAEGL